MSFLSLFTLLSVLLFPSSISTSERCSNACWLGSEDCCYAIEQPLYATSSSNRVAFYDPAVDEFERFGEGGEWQIDGFDHYIDFHPNGDLIYFSSMDRERVSVFEHAR